MSTIRILAGLFILSLVSGQVFAAIAPKTFSAGVVGGGYFPDNQEHLDDAIILGFTLGYDITSNFGLELAGEKIRTQSGSGNGDNKFDIIMPRLDSLYYLSPNDSIVPFFSVGIGGRTIDASDGDSGPSQFLTNIGLGVKCFINKHFAVRGDIKYLHLFNDALNNYEATLGLFYKLGSPKKAPRSTESDSDQDGVPDDKDLCANTPSGVKVGPRGCPEDSDNDGVPDYLDKCPGTPAGARIDRDGCPVEGIPFELMKLPSILSPSPAAKFEKNLMKKGRVPINIDFYAEDSRIRTEDHAQLEKLADVIKKYPDMKITIKEYADNSGFAAHDIKLSQERAESVVQYLATECGIDRERLHAVGSVPSKPIADNAAASNRDQNRRMEAIAEFVPPHNK